MSDEETYQLSEESQKALAEFLAEQKAAETSNHVAENWQLSQFWYTDDTSEKLANECVKAVLKNVGDGQIRRVACVSCPSVMEKLIQHEDVVNGRVVPTVFEFDTRFQSKYGDRFAFFDYNYPDKVDPAFVHSFDLVVADPPFLSDECQLKTAMFTRLLLREEEHTKIILCTGSLMERMAEKAFGARRISFKPEHKNNLGNEFACFTSYDPVSL